jgi:dTDP-4-dehydrorhamnose 3,5-epimerase
MPCECQALEIPGLLLLKPKVFSDERGFFKEIFHFSEFFAMGIRKPFLQANHSLSKKNTLRGLHYQQSPFAQAKLVRVLKGEIFDVVVDLRKNSPFYAKHFSLVLRADEHQMLFIPEGFAHGFLTLSDEAEVEYFCSQVYSPIHERGIIFNDAVLGIKWPTTNPILSKKDSIYPALKNAEHHFVYEP